MYENLMEAVVDPENVRRAVQAVTKTRGAPGNDGMTTRELEGHLGRHWGIIRERLLAGKYNPSPTRRVEIQKPDGGRRTLGIPNVQDRFIEQLLVQALTPIFDPGFSPGSYGYRPGRSAHDAVKQAQRYAQEGKTWVVDIDFEKFFDHIHHDILMNRIGKSIRDKRVLRLIGKYLRTGALLEGVVIRSEEGTPQGGPISPLLANIYLDALDKELEKRGHSFCRYADDLNIYVSSESAAAHAREVVPLWVKEHLRLEINTSKSGYGRVWERQTLGFTLTRKLEIAVSMKSLKRLQERTRELWQSCQSLTSAQLRDAWRAYLRGWWNYFHLAEDRRRVFALEGWIRRHMRACFWQRWHGIKGRRRALERLGVKGPGLLVAGSRRGAWRVAGSPSLHTALSRSVLSRYGFVLPSDLVRV